MKNKDFTYRCGFLPPLLLAIMLIALPQLARAAMYDTADTPPPPFASNQQLSVEYERSQTFIKNR